MPSQHQLDEKINQTVSIAVQKQQSQPQKEAESRVNQPPSRCSFDKQANEKETADPQQAPPQEQHLNRTPHQEGTADPIQKKTALDKPEKRIINIHREDTKGEEIRTKASKKKLI